MQTSLAITEASSIYTAGPKIEGCNEPCLLIPSLALFLQEKCKDSGLPVFFKIILLLMVLP